VTTTRPLSTRGSEHGDHDRYDELFNNSDKLVDHSMLSQGVKYKKSDAALPQLGKMNWMLGQPQTSTPPYAWVLRLTSMNVPWLSSTKEKRFLTPHSLLDILKSPLGVAIHNNISSCTTTCRHALEVAESTPSVPTLPGIHCG
jgi:hypothetical protein